MRTIGVIGGGLAGLIVAERRARAGDQVELYEAEGRLGGQLWTERDAGFVVEHGAEGFIANSEALHGLAHDLGIGPRIVGQTASVSYAFEAGVPIALGPGEAARQLGFQVPAGALGRGIESFQAGMDEIVERLVELLGVRGVLHRATRVESLERVGSRWRLQTRAGSHAEYDALVVACGAAAAAGLLEAEFGSKAAALRGGKTTSSLSVSLAYSADAVTLPEQAAGFIFPETVQRAGLRACSVSSAKLPGRAPPDHVLLRLFFRPTPSDLMATADAAWVSRAEQELQTLLRFEAPCARSWVSRWVNALPIFDDEYRREVGALEAAMVGAGVWLAGSAFHGAGIDAAVRSAERAARAAG